MTRWLLLIAGAGLTILAVTLVVLDEPASRKKTSSNGEQANAGQHRALGFEALRRQSKHTPAENTSAANDVGNDQVNQQLIETEEDQRSLLILTSARKNLFDPDPVQRAEAARTLAAFPDPQSAAELTRIARTDVAPAPREAAVRSLSAFAALPEEVLSSLLYALRDPAPEVQETAIAVLKSFLDGMQETDTRIPRIRWEMKNARSAPTLSQQARQDLEALIAAHATATP
ncbi:MAG: HEAT repeat domain-containing protein [Chthoniobacterales bacterium]|nr:HEAT repeat domain-containing protein [Chthoniobacterales bacterium]